MYGPENAVVRGVKEMSSDLGLPDRLVSKSLNFLEANHYLVREKLPGRGRPKSAFFSGPRLYEVLSRQAFVIADESRRLTEMYLFNERGRPRAPEKNDLKLSERFLLCVLLANADNSGCVSGVGFAKLRDSTGLTEARLKRHIRALEARGFIRQYIAGGIDKDTSRRVEGVYYLDLLLIKGRPGTGAKCLVHSSMYISTLEFCVKMCAGLLALHKVEARAREEFNRNYSSWLALYHISHLDRSIVWRLIGFFGKNASRSLIKRIDSVISELAAQALMHIDINSSSWDGEWGELVNDVISQHMTLETMMGADLKKKEALIAFIDQTAKKLFVGLSCDLKEAFPEVRAISSYFFLPRRYGDDILHFCFLEKVEEDEEGKN